MTRVIKKIYLYLFLGSLAVPQFVRAATATPPAGPNSPLGGLQQVGDSAYGVSGAPEIKTLIANGVKIALGFLGYLFIILILWGGFQWMTSGGDEPKIEAAKKRIVNATIGLVLVLAAYAIAYAITNYIAQATAP
mgnify:CR=1 FL=1